MCSNTTMYENYHERTALEAGKMSVNIGHYFYNYLYITIDIEYGDHISCLVLFVQKLIHDSL